MKTGVFAMIVAIAFVALVASKIAFAIQRPVSEKLDQQANRLDRNTADTTTNASASNNYKYNNNAGYFTSMDAEFEWNRFMVPGFEPKMIDPDLSIERDRETGRRLVEEDVLLHGTLRGLRNGD